MSFNLSAYSIFNTSVFDIILIKNIDSEFNFLQGYILLV